MTRVLTKDEIERDFPKVYEVFFEMKQPTSTRKRNESLHDYLLRIQADCWCRVCFIKKRDAKNATLL